MALIRIQCCSFTSSLFLLLMWWNWQSCLTSPLTQVTMVLGNVLCHTVILYSTYPKTINCQCMYCVNGEVRFFCLLHDIKSSNKEKVNEQHCTCTCTLSSPCEQLTKAPGRNVLDFFPLWNAAVMFICFIRENLSIHIHNSIMKSGKTFQPQRSSTDTKLSPLLISYVNAQHL